QPWWKANFFVREPALFGTWDGVFTSCMINIFGVVIFLRTGWMVGNAGIILSMVIILITLGIALITVLSTIGICERTRIGSGGVYFLLSHVLGRRWGATFGVLYCFGQAVGTALYITGFSESLAGVFRTENIWIIRLTSTLTLLVLLAIVLAGVKWVIKLQLVLLGLLGLAVVDFVLGTFIHKDTNAAFGITGYKLETVINNTWPHFQPGQSFSTVFGVFFPTATGVMAGVNMSGDLKNPGKSIPTGSLTSLAVSGFLYLLFAILLGSVCTNDALVSDYLIASRVSWITVLFLIGLYISSLSSCFGGLYGAPRVLQKIALDDVVPILKNLSKGRGPNKEPWLATLIIGLLSFVFILIGHLNTLGPIVAMPFMITYSAINYSYFALAMSYDKQQEIQQERTIWHDTEDDSWKSLNEVERKNKSVMSSYYSPSVPLPKQASIDRKEYGTLSHQATYSKQDGVKITINDDGQTDEKRNNKIEDSLSDDKKSKNFNGHADIQEEAIGDDDDDKQQLLSQNKTTEGIKNLL
ncbi:uncharacterized protein TRIADDRAFT_27374, partial [Trichoplax adhaerens]